MKKTSRPMKLALAAGTILAGSAPALAQYSSNCETYNASTTGVLLSNGSAAPGGGGQDDWYTIAGSGEHSVFTYAGAAPPWAIGPAIPVNPQGGAKFGAGCYITANTFARAQHEVNFTAGDNWFMQFDTLSRWDGTGTAGNNVYSASLQPSTAATYFQDLGVWTPGQEGLTYTIFIGHAVASAPATAITNVSAGAAFENIPVNHWIRHKYWWSFATNKITGIQIQDLTAGTPTTTIDTVALDWYLVQVTPTRPSAFRFFSGATSVCWDNLIIEQGTPPVVTGACCLPSGSCTANQTYNQCTALQGTYRGDGTNCSGPCPQPGACCFADGSCQQLTTVPCAAASGVFHGESTVCGVGAGACPQPGACCLADGTCSSVLSTGCASRTGVFRGEGVTCASVTCAQPYSASPDVGETIATAANITGTGPLPGIVNEFLGDEDVDMYGIQICDVAAFRASTVTWTSGPTGAMDTMLFLFRPDGMGVVNDDDNPGTGVESTLTNANIPGPGRYYLAISGWDRGAVGTAGNAATRIWATQAPQNSPPNGPGAAMPLGGWMNFGTDPATGNPAATGFYTLAFNGVCRVDTPLACYANCDHSTTLPCLNVLDFSCFLNAFAASNSYANCDNSTTVPVLNVLDFSCFLNKFAAGCSNC